jgi:hypothetical protein
LKKPLELFFILLSLSFLHGCSDNYLSQVNSKSILEKNIGCMKLVVFPPNKSIENKLNELYPFNANCDLDLVVSYKSSIVCNSNQNAEKKALGMAKSYLRLEIKRKNHLLYSYYIDLAHNVSDEDIENGFNVMKDTLPFKLK